MNTCRARNHLTYLHKYSIMYTGIYNPNLKERSHDPHHRRKDLDRESSFLHSLYREHGGEHADRLSRRQVPLLHSADGSAGTRLIRAACQHCCVVGTDDWLRVPVAETSQSALQAMDQQLILMYLLSKLPRNTRGNFVMLGAVFYRGNTYNKRCAFPFLRLNPNRTTMRIHNLLYDKESQSGSVSKHFHCLCMSIKLFEQTR